ncbi:MAG TPA: TetR/AcrR family transcriptional regulator, partial [Acidimicrobiales bacterium]
MRESVGSGDNEHEHGADLGGAGRGDGDGRRSDGRSARSHRTRQAVIDALLALIAEGDAGPSAQKVAERAGVSARTVFAHFTSLEDLHCAGVEAATVRALSLLSPVRLDQPLAGRIDELCRQRARLNEEIGPVTRAAALRAPASVPLAQAVERGRRASREQIERIFAAELAPLDAPTRRGRCATVDALVGPDTWHLLRAAHGLSPDDARLAVHDALHALLTPAAAAPSGASPSRTDGTPDAGAPDAT